MGGQFRVTGTGGLEGKPLVVGWDMGVAFEFARALGVCCAAVAEFLPALEPIAVRAMNEKIGSGG
jgi:hypothetical protein